MYKIEPPMATSFLCFFSVRAGTQAILLFSLVQSVFSLFMAAGSILATTPTLGYATTTTTMLFSTAWNLAGLPLILMGIWAVQAKNGQILRIFLYYLVATFFVDAVFVINIFLIHDTCAHLDDPKAETFGASWVPDTAVNQRDRAFACGIARGTSSLLCCALFLIMGYCINIVRSHVKELTDGGSASAIAQLMTRGEHNDREWSKFEQRMQIKRQGAHVPLYHHEQNSAYGSYADVPYSTL